MYDLENRPKYIAIETEEAQVEDDKGPTILKNEIVKAIKAMRRKKATGDDNIPVDLLKELGDSGLKVMIAQVNEIYKSGDWPKDFLDVTMIELPKKNQTKKCSHCRKKLVKYYVWSIALYFSEAWTLSKLERKYLESFEMWC